MDRDGRPRGQRVLRLPRVARLDPHRVVAQIRDAGGPRYAVVGPMPGGAVGAWLVRADDGHESVLTWSPARAAGDPSPSLRTAIDVMDAARDAGVPVPRYEATFDLGVDGVG